MDDIIVYHGSRGGIDGKIQPVSRARCDFGKGFYMGTNPMQAKGLIAADDTPVLYEMKLKLSNIPEKRILKLEGSDWLYAILAHRKSCNMFNDLQIACFWRNKLANYDIIFGKIADDRMSEAIERYSAFGLIDKGLKACLETINYGIQYVAKTQFACQQIEIVSQHKLYKEELDEAVHYSNKKREEGQEIVNRMAYKYVGDGEYLKSLIEREKVKERER